MMALSEGVLNRMGLSEGVMNRMDISEGVLNRMNLTEGVLNRMRSYLCQNIVGSVSGFDDINELTETFNF